MKNRVKLLLIALNIVVLVVGCQTAEPLQQTAMYRGDPRRTGVYDTEAVAEFTRVKWKFETGDEVWSSPVVAGGVVYFGSDDDHVYAVDVETGRERWKFRTRDDVRSSPAIVDGTVYFGSYDGHLYAVDVETGQEKWKFNMFGEINPADLPRLSYDDYTSSPIVVDGVIYVGSGNPRACFFAIDVQTGQEKWHFKPERAEVVPSSPAVSGDTIYFGGAFGNFYAVNIRTGQLKWKFETVSAVNYAPAIGDDGTVYFGSKDTYLYAVDGQTGEQKWRNNLSGTSWVTSSPVIAGEMIYAGTSDAHHLYAVRADTGATVWSFATDGYVWSSPAFAEGGVYVGSGDRHLYAVDAQTGEELWSFETEGNIYASPVVADGVVYIGSLDGHLYALH